ncbi:hypothetical protein [Chryseobacterium sp. RLHN22]|uniref:hypothetical protein n=1 Tax=Chryseobacterium sp. RLHN22 TaxID=3437885 RepID=UPI003D9BAE36
MDQHKKIRYGIGYGSNRNFGKSIVLELLKNGKTVFAAKRTSSNLNEVRKTLILTKKILQIGCFLNLFLGKIFPELRMLTQANIDFLSLYPKLSNLKIILELQYHFISVEESILFHVSNYLRQKN